MNIKAERNADKAPGCFTLIGYERGRRKCGADVVTLRCVARLACLKFTEKRGPSDGDDKVKLECKRQICYDLN